MQRSSLQSPTRKQPSDGHVPAPAAQRYDPMTVSDEAISHRAYHRFLARGCTHGFEKEDWDAANRELLAEAFGK